MSAGKKTTEQLVRKCFGDFICINGHHIQNLARAARRFVRMENKGKAQKRQLEFINECRKNQILSESLIEKFPKQFAIRKLTGVENVKRIDNPEAQCKRLR